MQIEDAVIEDETQVVADADEVADALMQDEAPADDAPAAEEAPADDGEIVVSIAGAEPAPEDAEAERAPAWVRDLRKANREKDRRIRELEAKLQTPAQQAQAAVVVGEKPKLDDPDVDYDAEKFAAKLEQWHDRKRQADEQSAKVREAEQSAQQAWHARLQDYEAKAKTLKVPDFEDAQAAAQDVLSVVQQGVILNGSENPALLVYALGKSPAKARELAAISDPVKFAFAVAKLETQLKVQPRKVAPAPEKVVRAAGAGGGGLDNTLERLRAEAAKTGDLSKVMAFKRQQREAAKRA